METFIQQKLRTFVVLNPVAGQREPEVVHELVESKLRERAVEFEIYETTGQENIREVVEQAVQRGVKMVLACGGDGTASAAASGMVNKDALFGIIPAGTWNALARNPDRSGSSARPCAG
jgi:diacylglycerol kinase family enzyme